jgi:hypothetical protein
MAFPSLRPARFPTPAIQEHPMASRNPSENRNLANDRDQGRFNAANKNSNKFAAELAAELALSSDEMEIALDVIAQLIPHLDLQGCRKVAELAEAQATLVEIMAVRQRLVSPPVVRHQFAA